MTILEQFAAEAAKLSVVITGGAGRVGTTLRRQIAPLLGRITIVDLVEPAALAPNETFVRADLTDLESTCSVFASHDAIVHLAGHAGERTIREIVDVNVIGTSHVYEAARRCGIGRVVLGSSNHVVGFYPQAAVIGPSHPMRPDSHYGLSKCWGELVAGLYFDKAGIRSLIIRIGNASERPKTLRSLHIWVSPADLAQLTLIGLTHRDVDATVVFGVSAGGQWFDNSRAEALGYVPQDRIADFADSGSLAPGADEADPVGRYFQGGRFCIGDHDRVVRHR